MFTIKTLPASVGRGYPDNPQTGAGASVRRGSATEATSFSTGVFGPTAEVGAHRCPRNGQAIARFPVRQQQFARSTRVTTQENLAKRSRIGPKQGLQSGTRCSRPRFREDQ